MMKLKQHVLAVVRKKGADSQAVIASVPVKHRGGIPLGLPEYATAMAQKFTVLQSEKLFSWGQKWVQFCNGNCSGKES